MPRTPKFVRIVDTPDGPRRVERGGREIHGLHYRRTTPKGKTPERGIYFKRVDGQRVDLGSDLAAALDAIRPLEPDPVINSPEFSELIELSVELQRAIDNIIQGEVGHENERTLSDLKAARTKLHGLLGHTESAAASPSKEKLSDCVAYWQAWKTEQKRRSGYVNEVARCFNEFKALIGDKPVNQLTKADFVRFERYLSRNAAKRRGNDWYNRRIKALRAVFTLVGRKTEYPLPDAWQKWFGDLERLPNAPDRSLKRALPPALVQAVLKVCDEDCVLDVEAMPKATQAEKAKRNQARARKREGVQWRGIVTIAVNCALGNQDICDIEWRHVVASGDLPHIDFPRTKADWRTGTPVDRKTPLLPMTVKALEAWRAYEKPNQFVFRNARRAKWRYDKLSAGFGRLLKRSGFDDGQTWSFRHFRKCPGRAARDAGLPDWMVQAVLGHVIDTVAARHYIEDPRPAHLRQIVSAIGRTYFEA